MSDSCPKCHIAYPDDDCESCPLCGANARIAELEEELEEERIDHRLLQEVRGPGTCQCSDDEACRFARERDAALADVERLKTGTMWRMRLEQCDEGCGYITISGVRVLHLLASQFDALTAASATPPSKERKHRCQYTGIGCKEPATKRVRYHHDGYENDKYMWACDQHAEEMEE